MIQSIYPLIRAFPLFSGFIFPTLYSFIVIIFVVITIKFPFLTLLNVHCIITVKVFDLPNATWSTLKTYGKPPVCIVILSFMHINPKKLRNSWILYICDCNSCICFSLTVFSFPFLLYSHSLRDDYIMPSFPLVSKITLPSHEI